MKYKLKKYIFITRVLLIFFLIATLMSIWTTYAKYYEEIGTNFASNIKRWFIRVNNTDIIENEDLENYLTPKFVKNENINNNVIAPGTIGYFDILLDYSEVDVEFLMKYEVQQINTEINEDFHLLGYLLVDDLENEDIEDIDITDIVNATENTLYSNVELFNENEESHQKKARILIFFEWNDDLNNVFSDDLDTAYSVEEKDDGENQIVKYKLKLQFKQLSDRENQEENSQN